MLQLQGRMLHRGSKKHSYTADTRAPPNEDSRNSPLANVSVSVFFWALRQSGASASYDVSFSKYTPFSKPRLK